MQGVMTTPLAIFLQLNTVRVVLLVLFGRVIAALALSARHSDQSTHEFSFYRYELRLVSLHMNFLPRGLACAARFMLRGARARCAF